MRFDDCGFTAETALYHVRINGSLYEEIDSADFLCFLFKYTDEFFSDNFTFLFGLRNTG